MVKQQYQQENFLMWVSETEQYVDDGIFFGSYRKGKIKL